MFATELSEDFNLTKACRLCLNQDKELISIFDISNFEIQFSIIISDCTDVTIYETDELPKSICSDCVEYLNKFYKFRKLAVNSEHYLHEFLNKFRNNLNKDVKIENIQDEILNTDLSEVSNVSNCLINCEKDFSILEQDSKFESNVAIVKEELLEIIKNETLTEPNSVISDAGDEDNKNFFDNYIERDTDSDETDLKNGTTLPNEFNCIICKKNFTRSFSLKKHLTKIHKVIKVQGITESCPFVCLICGKVFTYKSSFVRHKKTHTGEKLYTCKTCGKSCNELFNLKIHERTHTGDKPYSCKQCGKSFIISSHLKRHELTHSGEKPFTCEHCENSFAQSGQLKLHLQNHTGKKLYKCKCGKSFTRLNSLKKHEYGMHGDK